MSLRRQKTDSFTRRRHRCRSTFCRFPPQRRRQRRRPLRPLRRQFRCPT
jgi:hypothetical protein